MQKKTSKIKENGIKLIKKEHNERKLNKFKENGIN